mmetsp:Transcript_27525/g.68619  ORF Transcript_27525/g.68619 Transcript_27525/m.68619 type:complete len:95 (+) Transcript_27525:209-493(+)
MRRLRKRKYMFMIHAYLYFEIAAAGRFVVIALIDVYVNDDSGEWSFHLSRIAELCSCCLMMRFMDVTTVYDLFISLKSSTLALGPSAQLIRLFS